MKGKERVKTPQLADGDSTLDEVSKVIIQDTFILALFSIVMLGTALILITTHNGLVRSQPDENLIQEQEPTYLLAMVEEQPLGSKPCGEDSFLLAGPVEPDLRGESVSPNLIDDGRIFTLQRISPMRFSARVATSQSNSIRNSGGVVAEGRVGDQAPAHERAIPAVPEQVASGGSEVSSGTGDIYDGYAISTIINNP